MKKRPNNTSAQAAHPVNRVRLETKWQISINPVMPVRTKTKKNHDIYLMLMLNQIPNIYSRDYLVQETEFFVLES